MSDQVCNGRVYPFHLLRFVRLSMAMVPSARRRVVPAAAPVRTTDGPAAADALPMWRPDSSTRIGPRPRGTGRYTSFWPVDVSVTAWSESKTSNLPMMGTGCFLRQPDIAVSPMSRRTPSSTSPFVSTPTAVRASVRRSPRRPAMRSAQRLLSAASSRRPSTSSRRERAECPSGLP